MGERETLTRIADAMSCIPDDDDDLVEAVRESVRERDEAIVRARVAIALRAALRADEDARCEEALAAHARGVARARAAASTETWIAGADIAAYAMCARLREWPRVTWGRVPLALWERRPSLWAQSPPTSDARGPR